MLGPNIKLQDYKVTFGQTIKKIKSDLLTYDVHALGIVCIATIMHTIFY
jgi:hypothetical protein